MKRRDPAIPRAPGPIARRVTPPPSMRSRRRRGLDGIPGGLPCVHSSAERFGVPVPLGEVFCRQTGGARLPRSCAVEYDFLLFPEKRQPFPELLHGDGPLEAHGKERRGCFIGANQERLPV